MDTNIVCMECREASSATPSTRHIHNCLKLFSVTNSKEPTVSRHSYRLEAKLFLKRLTCNNSQINRTQSGRGSPPPPQVTPSDPRPNGNKRAFLCGITYKKQKWELKGSAHDLKNMKDLLVNHFRFPNDSILILADDGIHVLPTRKNIEDGFRWLTNEIRPNDSLVFYFSGHGMRQRDFDKDEIDGFDETICPVDFEKKGKITDNYINQAIVRPLIKGVTLHAIMDCCHSGTLLDLQHIYNMVDKKWDDNSPPSGVDKSTSGGKAVCFSACEDYQLAADTSDFSEEKEMTGAMTCAFIKAIKDAANKKQKLTYHWILYSMHETLKQAQKSGSFIAGIRRMFHRRILQDPQLSSSEEFNIATEFDL